MGEYIDMLKRSKYFVLMGFAFFLIGCQVTSDEENGASDNEIEQTDGTDAGVDQTDQAGDEDTDLDSEFQELFEAGELEGSLYQFQSQGTYLGVEEPAISLDELSGLEDKYLSLAASINYEAEEGNELGLPISYDFSTEDGETTVEVVYLLSEIIDEGAVTTGEMEYTRIQHEVESIEENDTGYTVATNEGIFEFEEHGSTQLRDSYDNLFQIYDTSIEEILEAFRTQFD